MASFNDLLAGIREFLDIPIVKLGTTRLTVWTIIYLLVLVFILFFLTGKLRTWVAEKLLAGTRMKPGARHAAGTMVRYTVIIIGFVIILQTAGIDLTALNVLTGAVGIGLGFGLQNIVNNFVSGIIILFERPITVGDRIVVGDVEGDVVHIGGRSTRVVTNDNITIIVPNSKFITENVVNWSHHDRKVRFRIPVTVAYGSDLAVVERLLLEAAAECPDVLEKPPPGIRFTGFGDNGIDFELRAWSTTLIHRKGLLTSSLNFGIYRRFREHGIEIPYPRREIVLRSGLPGHTAERSDSTPGR